MGAIYLFILLHLYSAFLSSRDPKWLTLFSSPPCYPCDVSKAESGVTGPQSHNKLPCRGGIHANLSDILTTTRHWLSHTELFCFRYQPFENTCSCSFSFFHCFWSCHWAASYSSESIRISGIYLKKTEHVQDAPTLSKNKAHDHLYTYKNVFSCSGFA